MRSRAVSISARFALERALAGGRERDQDAATVLARRRALDDAGALERLEHARRRRLRDPAGHGELAHRAGLAVAERVEQLELRERQALGVRLVGAPAARRSVRKNSSSAAENSVAELGAAVAGTTNNIARHGF